MNKKLYIVVVVAVVVALSFWWWSSRRASVQVPLDGGDINQDLKDLDINNPDEEFKQIDQDLNNL